MIDLSAVGELAARLMETIEAAQDASELDEDATVTDAVLIVEVDSGDSTAVYLKATSERITVNLGIVDRGRDILIGAGAAG